MTSDIDTVRCPLCGEINRCAMAGDEKNTGTPCWCSKEIFPQALLNKVPPEQRRKACICRKCVEAYHAANSDGDEV
ncbi:cysteine-rich CWC family protein [Pseudomonadota bacterium]